MSDRLPHAVSRVLPQLSLPSSAVGQWLIPAGREKAVVELIAGCEATPLSVENVEISRGTITVHLLNDAGTETTRLTIASREEAGRVQPAVTLEELHELDASTRRALTGWITLMEARSGAGVWVFGEPLLPPGQRQARLPLQPALSVVPLVQVVVCALALMTGIVAFRRRVAIELGSNFKITHALPGALQVVLFTYWLSHWPEGRVLAELLVVQVAYAYVVDFLFSVLHEQRWRVGLGPIPVVLSTNLFAQFSGDTFWCALLAVAIGLAAKTFITRGGRHIFNPSVIGLTVVAVIDLAAPGIATPDFAHEFDAPPNMTELILMLALIVQLRLPVVLVTLGATLGIIATNQVAPDIAFSPVWAAVTLVLCLLITDPATIPRTDKGKLMFGAFIGAGMVVGHNLLMYAGHSDFWAKVACVPLANLLVPAFDRVARATPNLPGLGERFAKGHVALWLAISLGLLAQGKASTFTGADAADYTSHCYVGGASENDCTTNPMYCRLFSFHSELKCWTGRDD